MLLQTGSRNDEEIPLLCGQAFVQRGEEEQDPPPCTTGTMAAVTDKARDDGGGGRLCECGRV